LGPLARARYGRLTGTSQTTFQVSGFAVQPLWRGRPPLPELRFPVAIAAEIYPFPSRTRKSSPPAPMVLGGRPPGRVGRRRNSPQSRPSQAAGRVHPSPPRGPRRVPASLLASGPFSGPDHRLAHSVGDHRVVDRVIVCQSQPSSDATSLTVRPCRPTCSVAHRPARSVITNRDAAIPGTSSIHVPVVRVSFGHDQRRLRHTNRVGRRKHGRSTSSTLGRSMILAIRSTTVL
jgi:hypothetical protein